MFYNTETKQFWTSHKTSSTIVLWSSSGDKDREIKCAHLSLKPSLQSHCASTLSSTPHIFSSIFTRIESAHPVICFCKVGAEEVWAGTFDSIIMLSNEGTRLHSTSTGAGRMIFIRLGTFSCAHRFARSFECLPHSFPHLCRYVWSGGGVSTSDLLASSCIFQWSITHPPTGQHTKLGANGRICFC